MTKYTEVDEDKLVEVSKVAPGVYRIRCITCNLLLGEATYEMYIGSLETLARDLHECKGDA